MVMGLVSGLALANYSDSGSFLVALSQDGLQQGGFWDKVPDQFKSRRHEDEHIWKRTFSRLEYDKENGQLKQVWEITFCSF